MSYLCTHETDFTPYTARSPVPERFRGLHEMGLRHAGGALGDGNGAFHHQRRHVPVRKRLAVVLRPRNEAGGERGFQARQRLQTGRRGAVDDHPRRRGLGRGEQFACHLRHRHQHLQGAGAHHEPLFVALHALHLRRKSLRHADLGPSSSSTPNATRSRGISNVRTWGCSRAPRSRWCNTANTSS